MPLRTLVRRCLLGAFLATLPGRSLVACGSGGSAGSVSDASTPAADATPESGAPDAASDATSDAAPALDSGPTDAGPVVDSAATADAPAADAGAGALTGPLAFAVAWTRMNPGEPADECRADSVASGGFAATSIVLAQNDLSSAICGDGGSVTGALVDLEIATAQYAAGTTPLTQALSPGTYVIGNEGVPDPDLCMLAANTTAILQLFDPFEASGASAIAVSGSVTVTHVDATSIGGSFAVMMQPPGSPDASAPQPLSGTFETSVCP